MPLDTGYVLQDRYRIVALLGEGGMGAVYRAWDMRLGVAVALKEMRPDPGLDAARLLETREQFHQEASVLSRLNHPHLVRVSDFFDESGNTYLVMAFVEGENLAQHIGQAGRLSEAQVLAWAGQLLDALAYCHREGVLHRDIKPQNVIVRPDGDVVLVDFGLVKLWDPADPRTRTVIRSMGTPQYAPPEQYDPQMGHTDPRSDLYSLGATLYHALTGQVPPTATSRIVNPGALVPVRQFNAATSPEMERALDRAMALQPVARFQTADQMRRALDDIRGMRAPTFNHTQVLGAPQEEARRRFPLGLGGALIAGLLICGLVAAAGAGVVYRLTQRGSARVETAAPEDVDPTSTLSEEVGNEPTTPTPSMLTSATLTPEAVTGSAMTPAPTATPSTTPEPTNTPTLTPSPSLTPTETPTPAATPTPSCPEVTGPFAGVWQAHQEELGCATGGAYGSWAAQEHFERGMMTWRQDNGRIYAHYDNGSWVSYADLWSEGDPDFSCGTPSNPPTPIRGFGKIWCTYDVVRNGLGNATGPEVGQNVQLQRFQKGFAMQSQSGEIYIFLDSGRWWVQ
jgi:eukaryotic-like serine/threonine-protein kinase